MGQRVNLLLFRCAALCMVLILLLPGCSKTRQPYPETERRPVTDEYYGTRVTDDYRWLENRDDPAVRKWTDEQNAYSRAYFDNTPSLIALQNRLKELYDRQSVQYSSLALRNKLFALKSQPPKNQPFIVVFDSLGDVRSERVVVDPNVINPAGTTAIDWFVPSRDGRLVAVSLSENGSEDGSVYVYAAATGEKLADVVPRAQYPTGGGSVEWNKDGTGFYYTRYPQGNERPKEDMNFYQQVYYHALGSSASADTYVIGREFPRIAEIRLSSTDDGKYLLATVANGDGGEYAHYLMDPPGKWTQITQFQDKITTAVFGPKGMLYLLSHDNAPRGKVLGIPVTKPDVKGAKTIIHETDSVISDVFSGKTHLYTVEVIGGPSQIGVYELSGIPGKPVPLRPVSSVDELVLLEKDELMFSSQTYLDPLAWYRFNPVTGQVVESALNMTSTVGFNDAEVVREFATSKDGTKIPMNIIRRKGTALNGNNPTILYGYGGFGASQVPQFKIHRRVWMEHGGVFVVANLRGGGEFGEEWHAQGMLERKQNVFDDFVACARHLIDEKYTSPARLAIEGGSNGGLLMGAVLTQHPELFRAVVSFVGVYDMLRVELFPNGAFNVTEFGTVKNPAQFKALFEYSPYHHVEDGRAYPAVLFLAGENDGRVDPANSRKMTARMQRATNSGWPILLRTDANAGHGFGTGLSAQVARDADVYAFLFDQLAVDFVASQQK